MVYFIRMGENGPIKIGYSTDPQKRLPGLQTNCPYPLMLLGTVPGDRKKEREIQDRFKPDKLEGEWYAPSPSLLSYLYRWRFIPYLEVQMALEKRDAEREKAVRERFFSQERKELDYGKITVDENLDSVWSCDIRTVT